MASSRKANPRPAQSGEQDAGSTLAQNAPATGQEPGRWNAHRGAAEGRPQRHHGGTPLHWNGPAGSQHWDPSQGDWQAQSAAAGGHRRRNQRDAAASAAWSQHGWDQDQSQQQWFVEATWTQDPAPWEQEAAAQALTQATGQQWHKGERQQHIEHQAVAAGADDRWDRVGTEELWDMPGGTALQGLPEFFLAPAHVPKGAGRSGPVGHSSGSSSGKGGYYPNQRNDASPTGTDYEPEVALKTKESAEAKDMNSFRSPIMAAAFAELVEGQATLLKRFGEQIHAADQTKAIQELAALLEASQSQLSALKNHGRKLHSSMEKTMLVAMFNAWARCCRGGRQ